MRRVLFAVLVTAMTFGVACSGTADHSTAGASPGGSEPAGGGSTSIDRVTVRGTVSSVLADRAFLLTDASVQEGEATIDGDLPVVVTGTATSVSSNEQVTVSGTLAQATVGSELRDLEEQIGLRVDDRILRRIEGGQLLVASSVEAA
jgi:hypothetical protein